MNLRGKLTRREALRLGAGTLLAAGLWPGALRADDAASDDFWFVEVNDLHYVDPSDGGYFQGLVRSITSLPKKPDFVLFCGDLSDNGRADQLGTMRDIFGMLKLDYYVIPGNHDHEHADSRKAYEDLFPSRANYHFEHGRWQFVALDTCQGQAYENTRVQPATLQYLDQVVPKLDRSRPTVLFTHFPMGPDVKMRPLNADDVLARMKDLNLQAVLCGHFHGFTERTVGKTILTTDRCCSRQRNNHDGTKEKGYFLCHASDGKVERKFIEYKPA